MNVLIFAEDRSASRLLGQLVEELAPSAVIRIRDSVAETTNPRENTSYDVAFIGLEAFGGDGLILANRLRQHNPRINLIFFCTSDEYMKEALELRASGYLRQPFSQDDVRRELEHLRYPCDEPS